MFIAQRGLAYRIAVLVAIRKAKVFMPMTGRVHIVLRLYPPDRRKRDMDNIFKCLFDSLEHGRLLENDNQIKKLEVEMFDLPEDELLGLVELYIAPLIPRETITIRNNQSQPVTTRHNESR